MGRTEDPNQHSEQERTGSKLPKYRVSPFSQRLVEIKPGSEVEIFTQKNPSYHAKVVGLVKTPKQPDNPQIELSRWVDGKDHIFRLGSGTSAIKERRRGIQYY